MDRGWHSCPCGPKRCNPLLGNVAKVSLCLSAFERFLIPRSVPRTCDSTRLRMFDFVLGTSWRPLACWPSTDSSWCTRHFSKSAFVLACSCQSKCQTDMSEKEHIIYIQHNMFAALCAYSGFSEWSMHRSWLCQATHDLLHDWNTTRHRVTFSG